MREANHLITPEELMAYLDGELAPDRAAIAMAHLEHCRDCQGTAADLQGVSRRLLTWQVEAPSGLTSDRLSGSLADSRQVKGNHSQGKRFLRWTVAFVTVCVGFVVVMPTMFRQADRSRMVATQLHDGSAMMSARVREQRTYPSLEASTRWPQSVGRVPRGPGPMIVRTSELALSTSEFDKAHARILAILGQHKGYVAQLNVNAFVGAARSLDATLRVPAGELEATASELKSLGRVAEEWQTGEEVTQQYVDLDARLTNARNAEQRLTDLLREHAGKLSDVLQVEKEIDEVREKIERMEAEKKTLANRIDFATLKIKVTENYQAQMQVVPGAILTRIRNAAVEGYKSTAESLVAAGVFLLTYGPTIFLWGALLLIPARIAWKKWGRAAAR